MTGRHGSRRTPAPWLILESGDRWLRAARRFAPTLVPLESEATVDPVPLASLSESLRCKPNGVLIWEVRREDLGEACDRLSAVALRWPATLRLVAEVGLSDRDRLALSEIRVAASLRHPEDLPRLTAMIRAHFAAS